MEPEAFTVERAGARIAGLRWGSGPPLLLLHPVVFSKAYFAGAAGAWGAAHACAALDLRGHGETAAPTISLDALADDAAAALDHLGWAQAAVGGTSLGAAVGLVLALRRPERVTFLVQDLPGFGPGSFRDPARTERMAQAFEAADLEEAARRITEGMGPVRARAWTEALQADWAHYDPAAIGPKLAWALRAAAGWRVVPSWPRDLAKVSAPTRILAVQGDPVHPWDVAQAMQRAIPGATLVPRVQSLSSEAIARQWTEVLAS